MEVRVIKIGNSKGIRLSKTMLEKYNIKDRVKLIMGDDRIIIEPVSEPRRGWDEAFKMMAKQGDDSLLIPDVFEDENQEEWE